MIIDGLDLGGQVVLLLVPACRLGLSPRRHLANHLHLNLTLQLLITSKLLHLHLDELVLLGASLQQLLQLNDLVEQLYLIDVSVLHKRVG